MYALEIQGQRYDAGDKLGFLICDRRIRTQEPLPGTGLRRLSAESNAAFRRTPHDTFTKSLVSWQVQLNLARTVHMVGMFTILRNQPH